MNFRSLGLLGCVALLLAVFATGSARAEESLYPPGITGLPDGRVYEQVSPSFKNGNFYDASHQFTFGLAAANGDSVVYPMNGAVGAASAGMITEFVSTRSSGSGWSTASTTPRPEGEISIFSGPLAMIPSSDFKRFLFTSENPFVAADPTLGSGATTRSGVNIFLSEDPTVEPVWIGSPGIADPLPRLGQTSVVSYAISGASQNLETVFFTYRGTLTLQDASRSPNVALERKPGSGAASRETNPWGFYEWSNGQLVSAGVLPNGLASPFGAVPANIASVTRRSNGSAQAEIADGVVSEDGKRAFFVSPDPNASTVSDPEDCATEPPCASEPPELYVREHVPGGEPVSVLVSRSALPGHEGEAASKGVATVPYATTELDNELQGGTDAVASADGSHVFFASTDRLTLEAPEDSTVKAYDYDISSGALTYLPGVSGAIVMATRDGSKMLFEKRSTTPWELELWQAGPNGGSVSLVAELPGTSPFPVDVNAAHASSDGSVFLFRANAVIPGGFNNGGETSQVYRYEVSSGHLDCVSCPPTGVAAPGEARLSYNNYETSYKYVKGNGANGLPVTTIETRGMSADGSRVFFDTPAALAGQDTNGKRDVYEWEDGHVYLISSGASPVDSEVLDSSETGGDVFFASSSELVPGDADEAADVYDARVPRPGDDPPLPTPCKGSVCQGPPSVPDLFSAPASATFVGTANVTQLSEVKVKPKQKKKKKKKVGKRKRRRGKGARVGRGKTGHNGRGN